MFMAGLVTILMLSGCDKRRDRAERETVIYEREPSPEPPREPPQPIEPPQCNASYEEIVLPNGIIQWEMRSHWVRCAGFFGQSRVNCLWRNR
jgi:hypothetical protein